MTGALQLLCGLWRAMCSHGPPATTVPSSAPRASVAMQAAPMHPCTMVVAQVPSPPPPLLSSTSHRKAAYHLQAPKPHSLSYSQTPACRSSLSPRRSSSSVALFAMLCYVEPYLTFWLSSSIDYIIIYIYLYFLWLAN
jgi:hypothetical protein